MAPKPAAPKAPAPSPSHQTSEPGKQAAQPTHEPAQASHDQAKQQAPQPHEPTPTPHEAGKQPVHEPPQEPIKKSTIPVTPAAPIQGNAPVPSTKTGIDQRTGKEPQRGAPPPTTIGGSGTKPNVAPAQHPEPMQGTDDASKSSPSQVGGQTPAPADPSSNPLVQAKIAHSEMVASEILSHLDWNLEHQEPYEFTPFRIFIPESLLPRTEQYVQQHLLGQTPSTATQIAKNGSTIDGKVWKVNDETKATALRTWVRQLHPMAYLGADMFILNGEEQACRVIDGF